jgi:DGQHR domain-containing protein|tara:strand:+ start:3155 stop:4201 length:1047 start_codon:yes stop_codon:yes gene_type:complete
MKKYTYSALVPKQSSHLQVLSFCAPASEIMDFARIDRIGRQKDGSLTGFQRPQVAAHIDEIRTYLAADEAVLPNSVVVAFTSGVIITDKKDGMAKVTIDVDESSKGFVVDGQQRLTALAGLPDKHFEVLVSVIVCSNEEELRKQFILINNTRPLPKPLIYELLPSVTGLPHRLASRSKSASLVESLNYDEDSSLHGQIAQHTNPRGTIKDTAMQKLIMNSLNAGVLRDMSRSDNAEVEQFIIISEFFAAVQSVFPEAWVGKNPRTSRLVHSVGIISMGFVLEHIYSVTGAKDRNIFASHLTLLTDKCAWTEGHWEFGVDNKRPWNGLQFIPRDYLELSQYLIRQLKRL